MVSEMVKGGFHDVVDEIWNIDRSQLGETSNRSEWSCWASSNVPLAKEDCDEDLSEEMSALKGHDLNRITPKGFLRITAAKKELAKEIVGMTTPNSMGLASMEVVNGYGQPFALLKKAYSIVVMRKQTANTYKARLVSRGDLVSGSEVQFSSAPTSDRCGIRSVVCVARMFKLQVGRVDVAPSFLQADTVAFEDRRIISLPGFIRVPPREKLRDREGKFRGSKEEEVDILDCGQWRKADKRSSPKL